MEKCSVSLRCLKSNLSPDSFANLLSPSPYVSSKSPARCFLKLLLRMWEGRERGGLFFRLSLPACTIPPRCSTAASLENGLLTRDRGHLGSSLNPSRGIGLHEPSARALGMVPAGSVASLFAPGHSLAAAPPCFVVLVFLMHRFKKEQ